MIRSLGKFLPSVPASPPLAVSKGGECNVSESNASIPAQKLSSKAHISCKTSDAHDPHDSQSVFKVHENEDDWEFAGDEEKEVVEASGETTLCLTGTIAVPNLLQLSLPLPVKAPIGDSDPSSSTLQVRSENGVDLDEEIGQSLACDWLEPPPFSGASKEEPRHQLGEEGVILEAFQQFQHDPQIQKMVVALATDEGVWRAVLANKKIQEYRVGNAEGDFEAGITPNFNSVAVHGRMASSFLFLSHNAVRELKEVLWDQMRGIIDVVEKRLQAETRRVMLDAMIRALMMITVFMLTLIALLCLLPLQVSLDDRH